MDSFGERIRAIREARGVSQRDAARGMGISSGLLAQLEGGTNDNPTIRTVRKVSEYYGAPMDLLIPSDASPPDAANRTIWEAVKDLAAEDVKKVLDYIRFIVNPRIGSNIGKPERKGKISKKGRRR